MTRQLVPAEIDVIDAEVIDLEVARAESICEARLHGELSPDCWCDDARYLLNLGFEQAILILRRKLSAEADPQYDLWDDMLEKVFGASSVGLFRLMTAEDRRRGETV